MLKTTSVASIALMAICRATTTGAVTVPCPPNNPCPSGFQCIARLYGEASQGAQAYHGDDEAIFPEGFKLDRTYQQSTLVCSGEGNNNCGDLKASDIPQGLEVLPGGSYYWAVLKPIRFGQTLGPIVNGLPQPGRFTFGMHLYCGPAAAPGPGCNVHADVCAKALK